MKVNAPTTSFPYPTITLDKAKLDAIMAACKKAGVHYGLGAKADSLSENPSDLDAIDCSGFVRLAVYQASGGTVVFPDGSSNQHEAIRAVGFKRSDGASVSPRNVCVLNDGHIRIGFLDPKDGHGIGHVFMAYGGQTYESHGGKRNPGPDRRSPVGQSWIDLCQIFVLC